MKEFNRKLVIGCFAPTELQRNIFEQEFKDANSKIIKSWSCHQMDLIDGTHLIFFSVNNPTIIGHRFDQCMLYNLLPTDLNQNIYACLSCDGFYPKDYDMYRILFFDDEGE